MKTLDRTRPFATVHGDNAQACFEQDYVQFDAAGNEIGAPKPPAEYAPRVPTAPAPETPATATTNGAEEVEYLPGTQIPVNWRKMNFQKRKSLINSLVGERPKNGPESIEMMEAYLLDEGIVEPTASA